mgnify:CR=1 FL=1
MIFFCQAEDGIRDLVRSRGLGDGYKRQDAKGAITTRCYGKTEVPGANTRVVVATGAPAGTTCLLYTSDAADERSSVDLGGRRIIKKKKKRIAEVMRLNNTQTHTRVMYAEEHKTKDRKKKKIQ